MLWDCPYCGCIGIAAPLTFCPMCFKERDMAKATNSGSYDEATRQLDPNYGVEPPAASEPAPAAEEPVAEVPASEPAVVEPVEASASEPETDASEAPEAPDSATSDTATPDASEPAADEPVEDAPSATDQAKALMDEARHFFVAKEYQYATERVNEAEALDASLPEIAQARAAIAAATSEPKGF